jgi:formylglycine-generating enzyme required for sulfatase activity
MAAKLIVSLALVTLSAVACATRPDVPVETPPSAPLLAAAVLEGPPRPEPSVAAAERDAPLPPTAQAAVGTTCPAEMVLVDGEYCTEVKQTCVDWMEAPQADGVGRCRKFGPSECVGEKVHKRFCVDRDEYKDEGAPLPKVDVGWRTSQATCQGEGKRLCNESEWNFACEGEEMYPYATGYERDANKCNYDQPKLLDAQGKLRDLRKSADDTKACVSAFGVRDMNGNVDEWTYRDVTNGAWRSALKGGWWMAARDRCRPATTAHDEHFHGAQIGFRCCKDAP